MNPAAVFDSVAARYDELWTTTPIGRAQRNLVWRELDSLFRPGDRILDIGCGTGEDAAHLAALGVSVHATDPSPVMIHLARTRGGFTAAVLPAGDIATLPGTYDGALSNFGALNCVEDLGAVARGLASVVRPGGLAAICLIGPICVWETLYYAARLELRKASRRFRGSAPSGLGIVVRYPSASEVRAAFAPHFEFLRFTGIGVFVPPSYVRLPGSVVGFLSRLDHALARLPLLRALADHRLFLFARK